MYSNASPNTEENVEFLPLITVDENYDDPEEEDYTDEMPVIPLRNSVMFPGIVVPINVTRDQSLKAIKAANQKNKFVGVLTQKNAANDDPTPADLYQNGVVARIVKIFRMPDGSTTVILHGRALFRAVEYSLDMPYLFCKIGRVAFPVPKDTKFFKAMANTIRDLTAQLIAVSSNIPPEAAIVLRNIENPLSVVYFVCSQINLSQQDKQKMLEMTNLKELSIRVLEYLQAEWQVAELKNKIQAKTKVDIDKQQRDYILLQQLKTIQE